MTFTEKNAVAFLAIAVVAYGVYLVVVLGSLGGRPVSELDYAPTLIATVVGAIVAGIVARIVISMSSLKTAGQRDQRDRDIEQLGDRVGQSLLVIGGLAGLVLALLEADWFWIANALYLGFVLSAVVGAIAKLVAYRRGLL